jgi:hypothetical protein
MYFVHYILNIYSVLLFLINYFSIQCHLVSTPKQCRDLAILYLRPNFYTSIEFDEHTFIVWYKIINC